MTTAAAIVGRLSLADGVVTGHATVGGRPFALFSSRQFTQ
jgi:hypothetical protein